MNQAEGSLILPRYDPRELRRIDVAAGQHNANPFPPRLFRQVMQGAGERSRTARLNDQLEVPEGEPHSLGDMLIADSPATGQKLTAERPGDIARLRCENGIADGARSGRIRLDLPRRQSHH